MGSIKTVYDLSNERDLQTLQAALLAETDEEIDSFSDEEIDTNEVEHVEGREGNSDTEVSGVSSDEDSNGNPEYFVASQKKRGKVVNEWKWYKRPMNQRRRAKHNILIHLPGVIGPAKNISGILDTWRCLINDEMLEAIVECTNRYISSIQSNYSRVRDAKCTDLIELKAFIGLLYLAGVFKANRMDREELWQSIDQFRVVMSVKRFSFLYRSLRFDNIETRLMRVKYDRLAPIREIFDRFIVNCQKCYSIGENTTVDEKLEGFHGRCGFIQYIPSKPNKYGVKIYVLVDSRVYYTYNLEIYAGVQPEGPFRESNSPGEVVKRLVTPIYGSGRNVTTDNWFTSYDLVHELAIEKLSLVGTLKKNKVQIPVEFKNLKNWKVCSSIFGFQKETTIVSYVPRRNRNVILLSSLHNDDAIDAETGDQQKPDIITFYNMTKVGVDTVDKMCAAYDVARNTKRWPMVIFFSMLNVAGINAQILYSANGNDSMKRRKFLRALSNELVEASVQQRKRVPEDLKAKFCKRKAELQDEADEELSIPTKKRCRLCLKEKRTRLTRLSCVVCKDSVYCQHSKYICTSCEEKLLEEK